MWICAKSDRKPVIHSSSFIPSLIHIVNNNAFSVCEVSINKCIYSLWHQGTIKYLCFFLQSLQWYWNEYTAFVIYIQLFELGATKILSHLIIFTHLHRLAGNTDLVTLCYICKILSYVTCLCNMCSSSSTKSQAVFLWSWYSHGLTFMSSKTI